jgi:hypothetical protein
MSTNTEDILHEADGKIDEILDGLSENAAISAEDLTAFYDSLIRRCTVFRTVIA